MNISLSGYEVFFFIVCYGECMWAMERFCKKHMGYRCGNTAVFYVFFLVNTVCFEGLFLCFQRFYFWIALCEHMALSGIFIMLYEGNLKKKILISAILLSTRAFVFNMCNSLFSIVALVVHHAGDPSFTVLGEMEGMIFAVMSGFVFLCTVTVLQERLQTLLSGSMRQWYVMLTICFALCTSLIDLANAGGSLGILLQSREYKNLYHNQLFSYMGMLLLTVLLLCMAGGLTVGIIRIFSEEQKKEQYEKQISFYHMLEEQYRQMERVRHDWKNLIIGMRELTEKRDWERLEHYIEQMAVKSGVCEDGKMSGNGVLDALLYHKKNQAEKLQIVWQCEVSLPGVPAINEYDLCVLLGNMLDNAIEECERLPGGRRFIQTDIQAKKGFLILEVKNPTQMKALGETESSRKAEPGMHGIGLRNIEDTVKEYHGVFHKELEGDVFCLSVLLPESDHL